MLLSYDLRFIVHALLSAPGMILSSIGAGQLIRPPLREISLFKNEGLVPVKVLACVLVVDGSGSVFVLVDGMSPATHVFEGSIPGFVDVCIPILGTKDDIER